MSDFKVFMQQIQVAYSKFEAETHFSKDIDRDGIIQAYLDGFTDSDIRQEHNCSCCKNFLREVGGLCRILEDGTVRSLWDDVQAQETPVLFRAALTSLRNYVAGLPMQGQLGVYESRVGTEKNYDVKNDCTWDHFYLEVPQKYASHEGSMSPTQQGRLREDAQMLLRASEDLRTESLQTVLDLIDQGSLYRGDQFRSQVQGLLNLIARIKDSDEPELYRRLAAENPNLCRVRNTAIGTLLVNLSKGMEIDAAVTAYEKVTAPENYQRPKAIVTPQMVQEAKIKLQELGLIQALDRRFATPMDIPVREQLFVDRQSTAFDTILDDIQSDALVDPKSFSRVEEVSIQDFVQKILPKSTSVQALVQKHHQNNFVTVLTGAEPSIFQWGNTFSWSYTNGVTDSIKDRVQKAGGDVNGHLRVSLSWYNDDDLDLHVVQPSGRKIYFSESSDAVTTGKLDVDMHVSPPFTPYPVENITWTDASRMREGTYRVLVNNYARRTDSSTGYQIQIECDGQVLDIESSTSPRSGATDTVLTFEWTRKDGLVAKGYSSSINQTEKWGVRTHSWTPVKSIFTSPNHWDSAQGNKHWIFALDKCIADEKPRAVFNEFIKEDLKVHKRVFEVLGGRIEVPDSQDQVSGLGFCSTKRNSILLNVTGSFSRVLKVNF